MVSKEKLVDGTIESILQLLIETRYCEHNILIYPNLNSFREIYTHLAKARIENDNNLVLLLPHYETSRSVEQSFMELDIRARDLIEKGMLEIIDSHHAFFDPEQSFLQVVEATTKAAIRNGKSGVTAIADMGSFFHRQAIDSLVGHECRIPAVIDKAKFSILCCYHQGDFGKLTKQQEGRLCENHYRNLSIRIS
jgi:hypothetical protein